MTPCRVAALIDNTAHWRNKDLHSRREVKRARSAECVSFRCVRINCPAQFSAALSAGVAASQWRPAPAGWITTSSGCSGSSPRSALYKICANKKIGESEGKKEHHGHHPEVQSLPEEKEERCRENPPHT